MKAQSKYPGQKTDGKELTGATELERSHLHLCIPMSGHSSDFEHQMLHFLVEAAYVQLEVRENIKKHAFSLL